MFLTNVSVRSNVATFLFVITATDTEPPVITCPVNISVSADPMSNSTSVSWPQPTYMDNFRFGSVNVTHENGSVFFLGTEVVVYTAFDTSGNNGSCSFSVTVEGEDSSRIDIAAVDFTKLFLT